MKEKKWRSEIRLVGDIDARDEAERSEMRAAGGPFILTILGDFSGAGASSMPPVPDRRPVDLDRDNFDRALERSHVEWRGRLRTSGAQAHTEVPVHLRFRQLDDFRPERIAQQIEPLRQLLGTRGALTDPSRFEHAAAEVMRWAEPSAATTTSSPKQSAEPPVRSDVEPGDLLDQILEGADAGSTPRPPRPRDSDLQRFIEQIVGPHLVKLDVARQDQLLRAVDGSLGEQLRSVLHDPELQRLEAAWRSLRWLVDRAETGPDFKIRIVHLTKEELLDDVRADAPLEDSYLARLLLDPASVPGSDQPALLVGDYFFTHAEVDVAALDRLGHIGQRLNAAFVSAASPILLGCASLADMPSPSDLEQRLREPAYDDWNALRRSPQARWVALALPRWLCRLPYGAETEPIEAFDFEEHEDHSHEALLWANPAFAVAGVVAEAFATQGRSPDLGGEVQHLEGLPFYVRRDAGETETTPCAEVLLSERALGALEAAGLLPLVSHRGTDAIALPCFQSIATPQAPLGEF